MTDNKEPMIKLEPGGKASILSYNVPDPTSYSGRNFIDLQLPASYFVKKNQLVGTTPDGLTKQGFEAESVERTKTQLLTDGERLSSELANLDPREVKMMEEAGKQLNIYRSLYGTLTYNYVDAEVTSAPTLAAKPSQSALLSPLRPSGNGGPDDNPPDASISIDSPSEGALFSGFINTGVEIEVQGSVGFEGIAGRKVAMVQFGSGQFITARAGSSGSWSVKQTITQGGPIKITAVAEMLTTGGALLVSDEDSRTVNVSLAPAPDTTPPQVSIDLPGSGQPLNSGPGGLPLTVSGKASDPGGSGVRQVEVSLDGASFELADPRAFDDWSTWSKQLNLAPGTHTIKARCIDKAGNQASADGVSVTVNALPPPDTAPPIVSIKSPSSPKDISGPFNGVSVEVEGTASDAGGSGIRIVQLIVDGRDETPPEAHPVTPGDWSNWEGSITVTDPGKHFIIARCYDNQNNSSDSASVLVNVALVPESASKLDRLILVESYRLSSYLGNYGAGKTLKTFSLLPGEKTKISVKTFTKTEQDAKDASSILDSFTQTSANNFETSMGKEQSDKQNYDESFKYNVEGKAEASWGWGSASISGGVSGGTNAAREEFAKNISNATEKHVAEASAKRDIQVNTSYEVKEETGEETSIEREIENINVSRTLNFIFRQMNQEFITILHLVDARIGYFHVDTVTNPDGTTRDVATYREVTLPQLDELLGQVITGDRRAEVRDDVLHQLNNVFDYQDRHQPLLERASFLDQDGQPVPNSDYLRVKKGQTSTYRDEATGSEIEVPGIIMAANRYVLRTEGIIVEALLGQGDGLDSYSHGLQDEAVRSKELANEQAQAEIERQRLAQQIVEQRDEVAAELFAKLYPGRPVQAISYVLAPAEDKPDGQPA